MYATTHPIYFSTQSEHATETVEALHAGTGTHPRLRVQRVSDWIRIAALDRAAAEAGPVGGGDLPELRWTPAVVEQAVARCRSGEFRRQSHRGFPVDPELERLQLDRLRQGTQRYGALGVGQHNTAANARARLIAYAVDGNQEHLVDALNLCEIEWQYPSVAILGHVSPFCTIPHWARCPDYFGIAQYCVGQYIKFGYTQDLVTAAYYIHTEWWLPTHPDAHFHSANDGDGSGAEHLHVTER